MNNLLEISNVGKRYAEHVALKNVSLSIPEKSIYGLLGPNGAGKTTLIRIITQIISKDEGEIKFNGELLSPHHMHQIGYLPEERGLYKKMKVGEQLLYLAQLRGMSKKQALEKLRSWFKKFDIQAWWSKKVEDLSKGMQQKVQFIATVMHEPPLIILDEPFSGFDPVNANLIKDEILALREKGSTIIFSTHRMESVEELCDQIALINRSEKILEGEKKAIKKAYKTNTYKIIYEGELINLDENDFLILSKEMLEPNVYQIEVEVLRENANHLLNELIGQVHIQKFTENVPSMNDIFISTVTKKIHE